MQLNFQTSTKMLKEELSRLREKINRTPSPPDHPFPRAPELDLSDVSFELMARYVSWGGKDKLSYTNLMHQIDSGKRKGHSDVEIVEAVVKAATPGLICWKLKVI